MTETLETTTVEDHRKLQIAQGVDAVAKLIKQSLYRMMEEQTGDVEYYMRFNQPNRVATAERIHFDIEKREGKRFANDGCYITLVVGEEAPIDGMFPFAK